LLLTALESFSVREAGEILGLSEVEANALIVKAWLTVGQQVPASVLLIEDDPITADDVSRLITEMGHTVVAVTADQAEAVVLAEKAKPDLVLSDIDLGAGGSGLLAVQEILRANDVPVIFVTGCPEMLLTGERPEPTYLVSKPFDVDALRVTVSQALSLNTVKSSSAKARQSVSTHEESLTKTG
jgi:CheY-like chemotaxis protein